MNGMDMMVNAILKATGFVREDFDKGVATAKQKAVDFEKRFEALETNIGEILAILKKGNDNAADVRGGSVDDGK